MTSRFSLLPSLVGDSWTAIARRMVTTAIDSGLLREAIQDASPRQMPALAELVRKQGVGAHMVHALHAVMRPERLAVVDASRSVTYGELDREINRTASALRDHFGIGRGRRVALMMENSAAYVAVWVALFRIGASAVHTSPASTVDELAYQIDHSGARVLFMSRKGFEVAHRVAAEREGVTLIGVDVAGADLTYEELLERGREEVIERNRGSSAGNIVYTSGTTGRPKGAVRDFASFGPVELFRVLERMGVEAGSRHAVVAPMYHSAAQVFTLMYSALGATLYVRPRFDAEDALSTIDRWRVDSVFLVPTMIQRILELPDEVHERHPARDLDILISGAAAFPHALRERAMARFGDETLFDFYGATELGWVTLIRGDEMRRKPGSVGRAIGGQELAIFSEDRTKRLEPGEVGLICVRNQQFMEGYLDDESATQELVRQGFSTVDDLGHLDADGYLFLGGRARDMVITGGVNVYPVEVEEVLAMHPAIREVAVIGLPDEQWGERLAAVVVSDEELGVEELDAFVRKRLTGSKVPRAWAFRTELPRNPTGKVLKRQLRESWDAPRS